MPSIFFDKSRKKWFAQVQVDGTRFGKRFEDKHAAKRWADELEFDLKRALQKRNPAAHLFMMDKGRLPHDNQFAAIVQEYIEKRALRFKSYKQNRTSLYNGIQKRLGHHKLFDFTTRLLEEYAYKRVDEDGRVIQFTPEKDKSKGAYVWKLFKDAYKDVLHRPNLVVHNIRLENATQLADRGMEDELRQRQTGHVDRKVLNDRYTRNRPEHRAMYYQQSFLTATDEHSEELSKFIRH